MIRLADLHSDLVKLIINKLNNLDQFVLRNINKKCYNLIKKIKIKYKCNRFAEKGYLTLLKLARENNCPWDEDTCIYAALNGRLEVLKWARANGCPWNLNTCANAAANDHLEVLKWAYANGCDCPRNIINKYNLVR